MFVDFAPTECLEHGGVDAVADVLDFAAPWARGEGAFGNTRPMHRAAPAVHGNVGISMLHVITR
jgi:hypothetical protein